jgi:hypothetical protein
MQGQRCLAQRFLRNVEPTMIDPKQGLLSHPGRGEQHATNLKAKLARSNTASAPEHKPSRPILTVVK